MRNCVKLQKKYENKNNKNSSDKVKQSCHKKLGIEFQPSWCFGMSIPQFRMVKNWGKKDVRNP